MKTISLAYAVNGVEHKLELSGEKTGFRYDTAICGEHLPMIVIYADTQTAICKADLVLYILITASA